MSLNKRVRIAKLEAKPALYRLEADAGERRALAELNKLVALERLAGEIELKRLDGGRIRLEGRIQANLTQRCVVSLEPVVQAIDEAFHYDFGPVENAADAENGEVLIDMESDVEPLAGDSLELGDILAEQLALAIDPYPRAPSAQLQAPPAGTEEPVNLGKNSPFAALAALKPKG
jgi:uncharacterized metal-binding protein YceD (DUF177 family)